MVSPLEKNTIFSILSFLNVGVLAVLLYYWPFFFPFYCNGTILSVSSC